MKRREFIKRTAVGGIALTLGNKTSPGFPRRSHRRVLQDFSSDWRFVRSTVEGGGDPELDDSAWDEVNLPHTARIEALTTGEPGSPTYQWQGECWYRRHFHVEREMAGRRLLLKFEGAMNVADVWMNGEYLGGHMGGYLPFGFDVTDSVVPGTHNVLAVRLDNTDNAVTGPKPLEQLDFNMYHGLYRGVTLIAKSPLHITDPIVADRTASGGVFVTYPEVSAAEATVRVQVHVMNSSPSPRTFELRLTVQDATQTVVADAWTETVTLDGVQDADVVHDLRILSPALWSPRAPHLQTLRVQVVSDGVSVDEEVIRIGIRRIHMSPDGFEINGERMFLRGTNRHQEYPYVGYALSRAAQYRDARKIKDAGFDYVRLSHYPHDTGFMDACDELGLVVMDCIPGWQYFNREDPRFSEIQYENCRRMMRRDRNHPCVILWEVSLNETWMTDIFMEKTHRIAHEEYPNDQCYTCGWAGDYDVFIQARQHGGCTEVTDRTCVVSEYGDWEYYAQNAGLNQEEWSDLAPDAANSRQLRWHGERALLQQATNFQEAHNDNRNTIAFADGLWVMFDYNRGYAPDIESSGCMDLFRLPKFSHYFFRSQRPPSDDVPGTVCGPMAFIANYWTEDSPTDVRVFSNCDEVELRLNGYVVARQNPDQDRISTHLAHPPFTFRLHQFEAGELEAIGFLGGVPVARHSVRTPGPPSDMNLLIDESGRPFASEGKDTALVHARILDNSGTVVPGAWENVFFGSEGNVRLIGTNPYSTEAGIASILVQSEAASPGATIFAIAVVSDSERTRILSASASIGCRQVPYTMTFTTDGTAPTARSPVYRDPISHSENVRAAIVAGGKVVVEADPEMPRFRPAGSVAPHEGD